MIAEDSGNADRGRIYLATGMGMATVFDALLSLLFQQIFENFLDSRSASMAVDSPAGEQVNIADIIQYDISEFHKFNSISLLKLSVSH